MRKKKCANTNKIVVRGFVRVQLVDAKTGKIMGEHYGKNILTTVGLNGLAGASIAATGSKWAKTACLATQTDAVDATHISMIGVENSIQAVTPTTVATGTARMTGSFGGASNSDTITIGAIGLHSDSNTASELLAGHLFTTSQMATNQNLNFTYEWQFANA